MDARLYLALNHLAGANGGLDRLLVWSATALPIVLALATLAAWCWPDTVAARAQRQRLVVYAGVAAIVALGIAHVIGMVWFRQRPFVTLPAHLLTPHVADASFPSDHAAIGFALATPFLWARRRLGGLLLLGAVLVAIARVACGLHYPSDVAGGALLGFAVGSAVWSVRAGMEPVVARGLALARRLRLA